MSSINDITSARSAMRCTAVGTSRRDIVLTIAGVPRKSSSVRNVQLNDKSTNLDRNYTTGQLFEGWMGNSLSSGCDFPIQLPSSRSTRFGLAFMQVCLQAATASATRLPRFSPSRFLSERSSYPSRAVSHWGVFQTSTHLPYHHWSFRFRCLGAFRL